MEYELKNSRKLMEYFHLRGKAVIPAAACNYLLGEFQRAICVDAQDEAVATELMSRGLARRDASGLAGRRRSKYEEEARVPWRPTPEGGL
jgi:hypothetical protein